MDIDTLKEFLVFSETNTFAEAAGILGCSPSALRSRISAFEENIGVELLSRSIHGFELTDAGRKLIHDGHAIVEKYDQSIEKCRAMAYKEYHYLNIAFVGLEMPMPLYRRLSAFVNKYPEIHIHFISDSDYSIKEALLSQSVDFYVTYESEMPYIEGIHSIPLWHTYPHIIVPQTHPLRGEHRVLLKDFAGEFLLLYPHTKVDSLRRWQVTVRDESAIPFLYYRSQSSKALIKYLLSLGKCLMIYPYSGATLPKGTMALPLADPHIRKLDAYGCYLKNSQNPALKLFLEMDYPEEANPKEAVL